MKPKSHGGGKIGSEKRVTRHHHHRSRRRQPLPLWHYTTVTITRRTQAAVCTFHSDGDFETRTHLLQQWSRGLERPRAGGKSFFTYYIHTFSFFFFLSIGVRLR